MILAGMDTTANSLARILQLLAERPDAQERLREEITHAIEVEGHGDTLDFDRLLELPYLDAVCRETLRVCVLVSSLMCTRTGGVGCVVMALMRAHVVGVQLCCVVVASCGDNEPVDLRPHSSVPDIRCAASPVPEVLEHRSCWVKE